MNAFALFLWFVLVGVFAACVFIAGYRACERDVRKARTDWRLSQIKHKNVIAMREYQTLARSRRHWMA